MSLELGSSSFFDLIMLTARDSMTSTTGKKHVWKNQDGVEREATVVSAPQNIPE